MTKKIITTMDEGGIPINALHLDKLVEDPSICLIAQRGSGKSWICRNILEQFRKLPAGIVICPTEKMNHFYRDTCGVPETYIYDKYTPELMAKILQHQIQILAKSENKKKKGKMILILEKYCSTVDITIYHIL